MGDDVLHKTINNLKEKQFIWIECTQHKVVSNMASWIAAHSIKIKKKQDIDNIIHTYKKNHDK